MNEFKKPGTIAKDKPLKQIAGLITIVCLVAGGWLAYFVITTMVVPASKVATEKSKIVGIKSHYASELAKLKAEEATALQQGHRVVAKEAAALQSLRRSLRRQAKRLLAEGEAARHALQQKDADVAEEMRQMAKFSRELPGCLKMEKSAAARLATILREDAQIQADRAPFIRKSLKGNFTLKHTGAESLAAALSLDTEMLARATRFISAGNAPRTDINTIRDADRSVAVAEAAIKAAIAESRVIVAKVSGIVEFTGFGGTVNPLTGVRVTLIPKRVNTDELVSVLAPEKARWEKVLAEVVAQANAGQQIYWQPQRFQYGGLYIEPAQMPSVETRLRRRLKRLRRFLKEPPRHMDAQRAFRLLWDCSDPMLYRESSVVPLKVETRSFNGQQINPIQALFLPWGVPGWLQHYSGNPSTVTHGDGSFAIKKVPPGAYYAFASYTASAPYLAWMVPVTVTSRQTVRIPLDSADLIEIWK